MTFAVNIVDSLKSVVRAYFNIKVSNNQGILITNLVQTEADFQKFKTGCESVIFENFSYYAPFYESYGDSPYAAVIECDVRFSIIIICLFTNMIFLKMVFEIDYIDKPNFLLQAKLAPWIQNQQHSDVEFEVEGQVLRGHKIILIGKNINILLSRNL